MKKFFIILSFVLLFGIQPAMAKTIKVQAVTNFSTANPPSIWQVRVAEDFYLEDGTHYYAGSIIEGKIVDVTDPQRLKRNAAFKFIPLSYYDSNTNQVYKVNKKITGKYNALGDIKAGTVVKKGAIAASSHFISGFIAPGVALVEGAVKNEEGNRAKSAAVSVYESTPLSYINKGKELEIQKDQIFSMSFKFAGESDTDDSYENLLND